MPSSTARPAGERGQASVELVALLPLLGVLALGLWQVAIAGQAAWAGGAAARAAARATAVGEDPTRAAATLLPSHLRDGLRVRTTDGDAVEVRIAIPAVVGDGTLGSLTSHARFEPQR
jgi:hypothetical protein